MAHTPHRTTAILAAILSVVVLGGCLPAQRGSAGEPPPVYALRGAGAAGGGLTRIDPSGRLSHLQAVEPRPLLMAPGLDGRLILLSLLGDAAGGLIIMEAVPLSPGRVVRRLTLPAASGVRLAAGGRHAALVYIPSALSSSAERSGGADAAGRCVVAVIDLAAFAVVRTIPVCRPGELVTSVAMGDGPGSLLYAGLWRYAVAGEAGDAPGAGRVLAIDVESGVVAADLPLAGTPAALVLAPTPDGDHGDPSRVYVAENVLGGEDHHSVSGGWRLVGLSGVLLTPEHVQPLTHAVRRLAATADARVLYAVSDTGRALLRIDLAAQTDRLVVRTPGETLDLLVTPDRVLLAGVPDRASFAGLWSADPRTSRITSVSGAGSAIALAIAY